MKVRVGLMRRGVNDPEYVDAKRRLQEMRDDLLKHLMGEAEEQLDSYQQAERDALAGGM